jgi:hypothetical protein
MARRFQVALSFPGEHRDFVAQVAESLAAAVGREQVLYDKFHEAEFARPNLDVYLPSLYREQAELIVLFLCPEYEKKRWCQLEWRHIRQLLASVDEGRIMLTSFGPPGDLSKIGILAGDGYADIGARDPAAICALIIQRLRGSQPAPAGPMGQAATPTPAKTPHPAVAIWQKKLDFLLMEEAKASDAAMRFNIQQQIVEARKKLLEQGGGT